MDLLTSFPVELLLEMFWSIAAEDGDTVESVVCATHVCTRWRAIALAEPRLWANFPCDNPVAVAEFLRRSRDAPLCLTLDIGNKPPPRIAAICGLIAPEIYRFRKLHLLVGGSQQRDYMNMGCLLQSFTSPAPRLEQLVIEGQGLRFITEPLFSGQIPNIQNLTTTGITIPIPLSSPTCQIKSLTICHNAMINASMLLDMLKQCPFMETFVYSGYLVDFPDASILTDRSVTLSHLNYLDVQFERPHQLAALLSHLFLPPTARLKLITWQFEWRTHKYHTAHGYCMLPRSLQTQLQPFLGLRRVEITHEAVESSFNLRAFHVHDGSFEDPAIDLVVESANSHSVRALLGDWPFDVSRVETLVVEGISHITSDRWDLVLGSLHGLKTFRGVRLSCNVLTSLLDALAARDNTEGITFAGTGAGNHETMKMPLCTNLRVLELVDALHSHGELSESLTVGTTLPMVVARAMAGSLKMVEVKNIFDGKGSWKVKVVEGMDDRNPSLAIEDEGLSGIYDIQSDGGLRLARGSALPGFPTG